MAITIAVVNQKGGSGKTTTAVNLAAGLGELGQEVLVVDADGQANATLTLFHQDPFTTDKTTIQIFGKKPLSFSHVMHESSVPHVWIVPTHMGMLKTEREIQGSHKMIVAFKQAVDARVREKFDFIVIDCGPYFNSFMTNALVASDFYIVPIGAEDGWALKGLSDLQEQIDDIKKGFNQHLELMGLLITRYDQRNSASRAQDEALRKNFGQEVVFRTAINENTAIAKANSDRKTIFQYDKSAQGAKDYLNLAREVIAYVNRDGKSSAGNGKAPPIPEHQTV